MNDIEITRHADAQPRFAPLDRMIVERGTKEDWDALHHLHYKSEGRPVGANYWRLSLDGETIGVTVLTLPRPLLKERHKALEKFKPGGDTKTSNTLRYKMINRDFRVVGRIVLDTMYRGVGASYRFQNLVARMSGFRCIEIQSAMSKYNAFAQRAGFRFVKPMRSNKFEAGVSFFAKTFKEHPADTEGLLRELESLRPAVRKRRIEATKKFYYTHSALEKTGSARGRGLERVENMEPRELITQLQQLILGSPLYGLYFNPDHGREDMPTSLPLSAFDNQSVNERLIHE